jgi:hypothetical protein
MKAAPHGPSSAFVLHFLAHLVAEGIRVDKGFKA